MNHYVSFRSADGQIQGDHLITTNAANNLSQRTYLVGGSLVPGTDSPGADDQIVDSSGAVCYETARDGVGRTGLRELGQLQRICHPPFFARRKPGTESRSGTVAGTDHRTRMRHIARRCG